MAISFFKNTKRVSILESPWQDRIWFCTDSAKILCRLFSVPTILSRLFLPAALLESTFPEASPIDFLRTGATSGWTEIAAGVDWQEPIRLQQHFITVRIGNSN
jgi:hypothetical protein